MLNIGFKEDIEEIINFAPENKKVLLFSATMPK
jgi:ATP-dependent RNA helicase DeaD